MRFLMVLLVLVACTSNAQPAFESQTLDSSISIGYGLAIGDVDGDNKPDILLADKKQFVWYRNGDWRKFILAENLTQSDNVCIAARDIDGDGKVEIAVGAQWNPGETTDTLTSGSVHFLQRPSDPTQIWSAKTLHHEPTVHRMKWVEVAPRDFRLIVVPLHGLGNKNGVGQGVRMLAYQPDKAGMQSRYELVDQSMHLTHNFDIIRDGDHENIVIAGKEGLKTFGYSGKEWELISWDAKSYSFGEVRHSSASPKVVAAIEPMHGNKVTVYDNGTRTVLDSTFNQGHALAFADLLGQRTDQIIAGWREPDKNGKTGIKIFSLKKHETFWLDENGIACEDLAVADLNGDNKPDVVAAGRATKNLKVYWNKRK
jgi:hypothetical protein